MYNIALFEQVLSKDVKYKVNWIKDGDHSLNDKRTTNREKRKTEEIAQVVHEWVQRPEQVCSVSETANATENNKPRNSEEKMTNLRKHHVNWFTG